MKEGLKNNLCLVCFFKIKYIINALKEKYQREFGLIPVFKAGLHFGKITTGEIGIIKKELVFTGDVLNTTARIQSNCNEYGVEILISKPLKDLLEIADHNQYEEIGECILRGKNEKVILYTITESL